ncbi:hypothetical protein HK097_010402 [Rhizophlyctis rosea]|uniref:Uncharacterized protein n=1 Tax=Rhizophlyctis rosea TaxID=64517 RepID=A0AAD5S9Y2_9FUNG|nr:hypothetical protein HK097_010402 [Rhizophlyctis rosea]
MPMWERTPSLTEAAGRLQLKRDDYSTEQIQKTSKIDAVEKDMDQANDSGWRLRDALEENSMLKDQLRALMDKLASTELDYARRQNDSNSIHLQEMETLTMQHMGEASHLREERDALAEELRAAQAIIEDLNTKLSETTETALFVTKNSDGWQTAEIDRLQKQVEAERKILNNQLLESAKQRIMLQTALEQLEDEFERVKDAYTAAQLQLDEFRDQLVQQRNKVVTPSKPSPGATIPERTRSGSVASVTSLMGGGMNMEDINF